MSRRPSRSCGVDCALALGLGARGLAGCGDLLQEPDSGLVGPTLRLEVVSGDGQQGTVGQTLSAPLRVRVVDAGRPLSRLRIEWIPESGSGTAVPRNSFTDEDGVAETTWTLGPVAEKQQLHARLGATPPAVFQATGSR